jgi:eukaryotic-like serine/threonine-protein kinase
MSPRSPRPVPPLPGVPERQSSSRSRENTNERDRREHYFLGRYRVVSELGRGGMASVHLGRLDGPGGFQKWVAIKRIHAHLVENDQFVDMFLDEARMAAGISHTNVAHVFDLGKDDDTYWLVMEYLHGEPLREIMRRHEDRRSALPTAIAARICADAADGLHAAHELRGKDGQLLGLVHRDINPHNLFVTYDGCTKLVDFGIAKATGRLASTDAGQLKGKIAYMAPEQVQNQELNRTTDIYALGIVLWELTTNQRLFRGDSDLDTLVKVQAGDIPRPSLVLPGYDRELERIVMTALAPRKEDRFQTARERARALRAFYSRNGALLDQEDVAAYLRSAFGERIARRDAHLTWASEVTSFIDVVPAGAELPGRRSSAPPLRPSTGGYAAARLTGARGEGASGRSPLPPRPQVALASRDGRGSDAPEPIAESDSDDDATLVGLRSSTPVGGMQRAPGVPGPPRAGGGANSPPRAVGGANGSPGWVPGANSPPGRAPVASSDESTMVFPLGPEGSNLRSSDRLLRAATADHDGGVGRRDDPRVRSSTFERQKPAGFDGSSGQQGDLGQVRPRSFAVATGPSSDHLAMLPPTEARTAAQRRAMVAVIVLVVIGLLGVLALAATLLPRLENP